MVNCELTEMLQRIPSSSFRHRDALPVQVYTNLPLCACALVDGAWIALA